MSSDIEKLVKELSKKIKELENRVSLLEDPMKDVPAINLIKTKIGAIEEE
ncbi:hypothetical protein [Clostridium sp. HCS.1]